MVPGTTLIDFGCGTGRGGYAIWKTGMFDVTLMDFAWNCLDKHVADDVEAKESLAFVEHDLTEKTALRADYGYCCDVMEHIPEDQVDDVLDTILEACGDVFFQIATVEDNFGKHKDIDEPLHLTVKPYHWWLQKLADRGLKIHRSLEHPYHVIFFVSGEGGAFFSKMRMNTDEETLFKQIRQNLRSGFQQLPMHEEQPDQKVLVLGGGPSLNDHIDEIREKKAAGAKVVTMNNSYQWAREHDLWPVTQFMIDARPFNSRFVEPVDDKNRYIIADQCHPSVLKNLPKDRTHLMHCNLDPKSIEIINEEVGPMYETWLPIPGGSSVMMRTLAALQQLGLRDIEIYGFDSCLIDQQHHAYEQKENDIGEDEAVLNFMVGDREFFCLPWMLAQARDFMFAKNILIRKLDITIHGDGLIKNLLENDFALPPPEE